MSLRDLFRPKWRNSSPEVRLSMIDILSDATVLIQIAKADSDTRVRNAAIQKLAHSPQIAIRKEAVVLTDNEDLLVVMAKTDVDPDVRVIAIGKVRDPIALSKILNDAEVKLDIRLVALKRIDDQCVIEEVAKNNDLDFSMREAAIEKLTKQDALFHLSKNDEDEDIRVAAVERLQDKKLLQDIANSDYHLLVRAAASDMLSKNIQRFLAEAVDGPSTCIIPIWQFNYLYFALTARLKKKGLTNSKIVDLVDEKLLGVCPDCATPSGGQGLSLKATYDRFGGVMLTGNTGGMEHLMEGTCRNQDCHSKTIIIFWRPDEDLGAVKRLAEMGIHVKHK